MLLRLTAALSLVGALLVQASPAKACEELQLTRPAPPTALPAGGLAEEPVLWCERADDPRCAPGSEATANLAASLRGAHTHTDAEAAPPLHTPVSFGRGHGLGPSVQGPERIDRPPRP
jgi:hypothetical protein